MTWRSIAPVLGVLSLVACSKSSAPEYTPCDAASHCSQAGYVCIAGYCTPSDGTLSAANRVGRRGGTVVGDDGVRLVVPSGALESTLTFAIRRQSSAARTAGLIAVSRVYEITPAATPFLVPATVIIPYNTAGIPAGRSASEVALWGASSITGTYAARDAGTPEAGAATGLTTGTGYFVAGLPLTPTNGGSGPSGPVDPPQSDPGRIYFRDCSVDASACDPAEPVCFPDWTGAGVCTGTCQFASDCPLGGCCFDSHSDGNPATIVCIPEPWDGCPMNLGIPAHRDCTFDPDCRRGGPCIGGKCQSAAAPGGGLADFPCAHTTDCDLGLTDACVHRLDGTGRCGAAGEPCSTWSVSDKSLLLTTERDMCATRCGPGGSCGLGDCCRLASTGGSTPPVAVCLTGDNCTGTVVGLYGACDDTNPGVCDPTVSERCLSIGTVTACTKACTSAGGAASDQALECGTGNSCCALAFPAGQFCVQGSSCP